MTYKQIEQAREIRLWITQIFAPVAVVTAVVIANPKTRQAVGDKVRVIKQKFRNRKLNKG